MDGVLLIDKSAGMTSHDVVNGVRRGLGGRKGPKVGHAGTLDPFATGLLLVLVGIGAVVALRREPVDRAYAQAVAGGYLWHEFGDTMLFLP